MAWRRWRERGAADARLGAGARRGALPGASRAWVDALIDACAGRRGRWPAGAAGGRHAEGRARRARRRAPSTARDKWAAQTPQMFRIGVLREALARAGDAVSPTRPSAIEALGLRRCWWRGELRELQGHLARGFRAARAARCWRARDGRTTRPPARSQLRIGEGWDMHALVAGRPLVLGGVDDPAQPRPARPLGRRRAAARDHRCAVRRRRRWATSAATFPDTDERVQGRRFAGAAGRGARGACAPRAGEIGNVDSTVIAQAPKLAPHIPAMCAAHRAGAGVGGRPGQRQGQDGREDGAGGRGPGDRGARGLPAAARRRRLRPSRDRRASGRALQPDVRDQAAVGGVGELEAAAHALHRLLDDRQPQAGAGGGRARRVAAEERRGQLARASPAPRPGRGRAR